MKKNILIALLLMSIVVATEKITLAETDDAITSPAEQASKVIESIAVPQSPAFAVLGVTPDKIVRPGNVRELALGLIQGVDEHGNLQNGVALDFSPYLLMYGDDLTLEQYREKRIRQFLTHLQLSLGTSKGQDVNDPSERFAAGLHATVFDFGDPRNDRDLDRCLQNAHEKIFNLGPIPPTANGDELAKMIKERETILNQETKKCLDTRAAVNIGAQALDIGLSPLWISEDGQSKNLHWSGLTAWSSYKIGFGRLLTIANVQYKSQDKQPDPTQSGSFLRGRSWTGGLKARYGSPASAFLAQGAYTEYSPEGTPRDEKVLYSIGGEIKLADNLWLEVSVGGSRDKHGDEESFVTSQFKWGTAEKSILKDK